MPPKKTKKNETQDFETARSERQEARRKQINELRKQHGRDPQEKAGSTNGDTTDETDS